MRRLAARRTGGSPDNKPGTGRHPVALLAGGPVAALLVVAIVVWWPLDRPAGPLTSVSTSRATRPPADPAVLQRQLDGVVEAGVPGVVGLGTRYGLGLEVLRQGCGVELWGHGGSLEGYGTTAFSTPEAGRQLVMATNLQPEPEPGAARAAVENILRREVSC
jgi:Beta-lactamase